MPHLLKLAALILLATTPLAAQTAPNTPQILSALVVAAPAAGVLSDTGAAMPDGTGTALVTQLLFELGVHASDSTDRYRLLASCDPAPVDGDWDCRVQLNVDWSGGESAHILLFALTPVQGQSCAEITLDVYGRYDPCAWEIRDGQIVSMLAG